MYLLLHNRYICYVVIVIISIIHGFNRPRKRDSRRWKEERLASAGNECALARSTQLLPIILALQRGLRRFPIREAVHRWSQRFY